MSRSSKSVTPERLTTPKHVVTDIRKFPKADKEAKVPVPKPSNLPENNQMIIQRQVEQFLMNLTKRIRSPPRKTRKIMKGNLMI